MPIRSNYLGFRLVHICLAVISVSVFPTEALGQPVDDGTQVLAMVRCDFIELLEPIVFTSAGTGVAEASLAVLEDVAEILLEAHWIIRVEVQVHSDSQGVASFNLTTTNQRAHVVVAQLVVLGVSEERLVARGMGEAYPIASNSTAQGRASNRRVELIIVEAETCPLEGE